MIADKYPEWCGRLNGIIMMYLIDGDRERLERRYKEINAEMDEEKRKFSEYLAAM